MAFRPLLTLATGTALLLSACGGAGDGAGPPVTRALLPPMERAAEVTEAPVADAGPSVPGPEADRLARTDVRAVLAAAGQLFGETGSYDADPDEISERAGGVPVVSLEEAARSASVVYDAHGQRLTLYRQSTGGRWFCIDVGPDGADYGSGDTFSDALASCTDGVRAAGWGDSFSPTGPDEAAITAVLSELGISLAAGDPAGAHPFFDSAIACAAPALEEVWPDGLGLIAPDAFTVESMAITGDRAIADVRLGDEPIEAWPLIKQTDGWLLAVDPCARFATPAGDLATGAALDLLERGLFAVRSIYVERSDFAFGSDLIAARDADLVTAPLEEVTFGTLAYTGSERQGLLVTATASGRFVCAVESSFTATVYGEGEGIGSVNECEANATP